MGDAHDGSLRAENIEKEHKSETFEQESSRDLVTFLRTRTIHTMKNVPCYFLTLDHGRKSQQGSNAQ